jgi:hypothetical protein
MRLSMPATTDYWVNDQAGDPLSDLLISPGDFRRPVKTE